MSVENLAGQNIGEQYRLLSLLGSGGMGTVYKAVQISLDRIVAIKVLQSGLITSVESRARFEREGKLLSDLKHRHIISFYHFGVHLSNYPYIAMEYLDGITLRSVLDKEAKINWRRAVTIGAQICAAMKHAHEHNIVHRDLKPENIMLMEEPEPDFVKVFDFGLAKLLDNGSAALKLTKTGILLGSVNYLSPEQCQGKSADKRSDIYALGCLLYEAVTGTPPFVSDNPVELINKHVNELPKRFSKTTEDVDIPEELEFILFKALEKEPQRRYQTMEEVLSDLTNLLEGQKNRIVAQLPFNQKKIESNIPVIMIIVVVLLFCLSIYIYEPALKAIFSIEATHRWLSVDAEVRLGDWLVSSGKPDTALELYRRALNKMSMTQATQLHKTAVLMKIAELYKRLDDKDEYSKAWLEAFGALYASLNANASAGVLQPEECRLLEKILALQKQFPSRKIRNVLDLYWDLSVRVCERLRHDLKYALLIQESRADLIERAYGEHSMFYALSLVEQGRLLALSGALPEAKKRFNRAVHLINEEYPSTSARKIADLEKQMGMAYLELGDLTSATECWNRAKKIYAYYEKLPQSKDKSLVFMNLGLIYLMEGELEKGRSYCISSLQMLKHVDHDKGEEKGNRDSIMLSIEKIAVIQKKHGNLSEAEKLSRLKAELEN